MRHTIERAKINEKEHIKALFKAMPRLAGMVRTIYRCGHCGQIQAHHYIPFGLGRGATFNACLCQLTSNQTHVLKVIAERKP